MFDPDPSPYRATDFEDEPAAASGPYGGQRGSALPLAAQPLRTERGWTVRLPVRAEHVWVEKRAQAVEQVTVRLRRVEDTQHRIETVRREAADVSYAGDPEATRPTATLREEGR
jgi:stress response protein YsnF